VREAAEFILQAQGRLEAIYQRHLMAGVVQG